MNAERDHQSWPLQRPPAGASVWASLSGTYQAFRECHHGHFPARQFHPHLITRGRGFVMTPSARVELAAGDMFMLWPGVRFEYGGFGDSPWGLQWLRLEGDGVEEWASACGFTRDTPWLRPASTRRVEELLQEIHVTMRRRRWADALHVVAGLYELVPACSPGRPRAVGPAPDLVSRTTELLGSAPGLNVQQLADALGVSRTTLYLQFRALVGTTPIEHVTSFRLQRARALLATTDLKVAAVAHVCGFAEEKYFLRRFREAEGCTPTQFRRRSSC